MFRIFNLESEDVILRNMKDHTQKKITLRKDLAINIFKRCIFSFTWYIFFVITLYYWPNENLIIALTFLDYPIFYLMLLKHHYYVLTNSMFPFLRSLPVYCMRILLYLPPIHRWLQPCVWMSFELLQREFTGVWKWWKDLREWMWTSKGILHQEKND